jgi:hypothetical protein
MPSFHEKLSIGRTFTEEEKKDKPILDDYLESFKLTEKAASNSKDIS